MNRRRLTNEDVYDIRVIDTDETVLDGQFTVKGLKKLTFELGVGRHAGIPIWKVKANGVRSFLIKSRTKNHEASLNDMLQSKWECRKVYFGRSSYDCILFIRKKEVYQFRRQIDISKQSEERGHLSKAAKEMKGKERVRENESSKALGSKKLKINRRNTQKSKTNENQSNNVSTTKLSQNYAQRESNVILECTLQNAGPQKQTRDCRYLSKESSESDETTIVTTNGENIRSFLRLISEYAPWEAESVVSKAFGESVNILDDCVKVIGMLLNSHGTRILLDWQKCNSFAGLATEVEQSISSSLESRFNGSKSSFLLNRWENLRKVHAAKSFYYEASFHMLYRYSLDVYQLCDILEFAPPNVNDYFQQLLLNTERGNWYVTTKKNWLDNQVPELLKINYKESSWRNKRLARLPWTMAIYQYLFCRFGYNIDASALNDILLNGCDIEQSHIMNLIIEHSEFDAMCSQIFDLGQKQDLFKLLQYTSLTDSFHTFCVLVGKDCSSKIEMIEEVTKFAREHSFDQLFEKRVLVALFVQAVNVDPNVMSLKRSFEGFKNTLSFPALRQSIADYFLEKMYTSVTPKEKKVKVFSTQLTNHKNDTFKDLSTYYVLVGEIGDIVRKELIDVSMITSSVTIKRIRRQLVTQSHLIKCIDMVDNSPGVTMEDIFRIIQVICAMNSTKHKFMVRSSQKLILLYLLFVKQSSSKGILAQIYTGEGKTCLTALLAGFWALKGKKVDVITSSDELTKPQLNQMKYFYDACKLTTMVLDEGMSDREAIAASDIVYGTVNSFIGHKLRCREIMSEEDESRMQQVVIIDEVDNMLFDRKSALVQLTSSETKALMPLLYPILFEIYFKVKEEFLSLELEEKFDELPPIEQDEFILSEIKKSFTTPEISLAAHRDIDVWDAGHRHREIKLGFKEPFNQMIKNLPLFLKDYVLHKFELWIENCYKAIFYFARDVSYLRDKTMNKNIKIDSQNTGVLMRNTELSNGLEQFLAMKENSQLLPCSLTASFYGIAQYFNNYETMFGLTGTLGTEDTKAFLRETYNVDTVSIPSHFEDLVRKEARSEIVRSFYRCFEFPAIILKNKEAWMNSIVLSTFNQTVLGRPVLVFLESLKEIESIRKKLETFYNQNEENVTLLRYDSVNKLASGVIGNNHVILATNIAGRGTDLEMSPSVKRLGGLHVCLTYLPDSERVEIQCVGRTSRKGEVGTAQLIILSYEDASIDDLREARNKARARELVEAKETLARYKQAQDFDAKHNNFVKDKTEFVGVRSKMMTSLVRLTKDWEDYNEGANIVDVTEKRAFLDNYIQEDICSEVRRAFVLGEVIKYQRVPYNRVCLDYIKQQWAFWMDRNCFSQYRRDDSKVKDKYSRNLQYSHGILQNGLVESQHYVFLAREAFRLLASDFHEKVILSGLAELFDETDFGEEVDKILKRESESESDHFENRYVGLAMYYYAGYQIKKILQGPPSVSEAMEKIKKILLVSERFIKVDIIDFFERLKTRISGTGVVYNNLNIVQQVFKDLCQNIVKMILELNRSTETDALALHKFMPCYISDAYKVDVEKKKISNTTLNQIIVHCNAFGYFGEFFIHKLDDHLEHIPRRSYFLSTLVLNKVNQLFSVFCNLISKNTIGMTIVGIKVTKKGTRTLFNVHSLGAKFEVALSDMLDFYLAWHTKNKKLSSRAGRVTLLLSLTKRGVREQKKISIIREELEKQVGKDMDYINGLEDEIEKTKKQLREQEGEFRKEHSKISKTWLQAMLRGFDQKKSVMMGLFRLDTYNGEISYQEILRRRFSYLVTNKDSRVYTELHDFRLRDKEIDEIVIIKYVKAVYRDLKTEFEKCQERWKVIQTDLDVLGPDIEKEATKRYKLFIMFLSGPFIEAYIPGQMTSFREQLEKKINELKNLHSKLAERFKSALKLDFTVCPCCQEDVPLEKRIRAVAAGFRIVLVIYQNSQRVAILDVEEPVGIERVSLMTEEDGKNLWEVKGKRNTCLIAILAREHTVYDKKVLMDSDIQAKQIVAVKENKINDRNTLLESGEQDNFLIRTKERKPNSEIEKPQKILWHPDDDDIGHQSYLQVGYGDLPSLCLLKKKSEMLLGYHNVS